MPRLPLGRTLAAVVVSLTLATPWCSVAAQKSPGPPQVRPTASTRPYIALHRWGWLTRVWAKVGCTIDPSGHGGHGLFACAASLLPDLGSYQSDGEVGCTIDPSGNSCSGD